MKKLIILSFIILAAATHSFAGGLDSLKQQLQATTLDSAKADIYTHMVSFYLDEKNSPNRYQQSINAENAINYTMLALHIYSKYDDTTGLKSCYSSLSKAYRMQKRYAQAKWFILQANTLARQQADIHNIISTLVDLAAIKMDIKDYNLARRDLNEALRWSMPNDSLQTETVKKGFTRLYTYIDVPTNENIFEEGNNIAEIIAVKPDLTAKTAKLAALKHKKAIVSRKKIYVASNTKVVADTTPVITSL